MDNMYGLIRFHKIFHVIWINNQISKSVKILPIVIFAHIYRCADGVAKLRNVYQEIFRVHLAQMIGNLFNQI